MKDIAMLLIGIGIGLYIGRLKNRPVEVKPVSPTTS